MKKSATKRAWFVVVGIAVALVAAAFLVPVSSHSGSEAAGSSERRASSEQKAGEKEGQGLPERVGAYQEAGPQPSIHQTANPNALPRKGKHGHPRLPFNIERVFGSGGTVQDWEPAIATDPSDATRVYQAVTRFGGTPACGTCPDPAVIVRSSTDAGAHWGSDTYVCACAGTTDQDDPQLVVTNTGVVYAVWMESYVPGVSFAKSSDHGATWTTPIHIDGGGTSKWYSDKPWLVTSPSGQDVYIAISAGECGTSCGEFYVVASHDYGATFGARVKANTDTLYWYPEGGAVAPNGDVYFAASADPASGSTMQVVRSTNGGVSWTTQQLDTSAAPNTCGSGCPAIFLEGQASMDIDPAGTMLFAYAANAASKTNKTLYYRTSTNGTTWSARQVLNSAGDSNFPQVVAAGVNDFRVAWMDSSATGGVFNVRYAQTKDAGATWQPTYTASNATSGATYKSANGFTFPYGDYFEMDVSSVGRPFLIWGEGDSYSGNGGTWYTRGSRNPYP